MIAIYYQLKIAPNKLLQQFAKCDFFGCLHPLFEYKNYATSEEIIQQILTFLKFTTDKEV